jgi:predicted ATPase
VSNAKLISLSLERFKSYRDATTIEFAPLTVILGRNNSGKSSIIQALLLLKQTLSLPRPDVPLHLEGFVDALNLRELTHGWPAKGPDVAGPKISVCWSSEISVHEALSAARNPDPRIVWSLLHRKDLRFTERFSVTTELTLDFSEREGRTTLRQVSLGIRGDSGSMTPTFSFSLQPDGTYLCSAQGTALPLLTVDLDHFLPYLLLERGGRDAPELDRNWYAVFLLIFAQPLESLKSILDHLAYLGSMRVSPSTLYRPASVPPEDIGVSGEYAAQMLHARQSDHIHYLPPIGIDGGTVTFPDTVRSRSLVDAVNDVFAALGVDTPLRLDDLKEFGFRLLFGQASLQHVGRGLSYLLPVVQLGLIADPLRFRSKLPEMSLSEYERACAHYTHCALEEPEAHLHPKVQTRLAHWLVSLAMARRQIIVETHSDHMVRRLRGLVARAQPGSAAERWLLGNVRVLQIEQEDGVSVVKSATLTALGGLETWPAEFMDEATEEERSIYDASLDKPETSPGPMPPIAEVVEDVGEEPDLPQ